MAKVVAEEYESRWGQTRAFTKGLRAVGDRHKQLGRNGPSLPKGGCVTLFKHRCIGAYDLNWMGGGGGGAQAYSPTG